MKLLGLFLLLLSTTAVGEVRSNSSFDLGIVISPSFSPEGGYEESRLRLGVEAGYSFFKFEDDTLLELEGITKEKTTTFKLLRVGLGTVNNKPVATFSPISVRLQDRLYLSPTFGFGESPYTIFSISFELIP